MFSMMRSVLTNSGLSCWFALFSWTFCLLWLLVPALPDAATNATSDSSPDGPGTSTTMAESCVNATSGEAGRCMFALDCFRSKGRHIGVCTRGFYYGSCCALPQEMPRVPILVRPPSRPSPSSSNALDTGPNGSGWSVFWPDWLNDIYGFQDNALNPLVSSASFPLSSFHAPPSTTTTTTTTEASSTSRPTSTTSERITSPVTPSPTTTGSTAVNETASSTTTTSTTPLPAGRPNVTIIYATMSGGPLESLPSSVDLLETGDETTETTTVAVTESTTTIRVNATTSGAINALLPAGLTNSSASSTNRDESTSTVCGKPVYRWPKIVSGETARHGQWPWQISLQEKTRRGYFHRCGASLLSREWAVTAAHCLNNVQQENLLVRMGGVDFASYEDKFLESKVAGFQHPKFNVQTQQYDIALLRLTTPVSYQTNILPICLPSPGMEFDNDMSFVSGWGRLGEKEPSSTKLQYVGVPIIPNAECEKIYKPINKFIDHRSICAGFPMGLKDSCEGDSGGPMMVFKGRWVLAGVISWGVGCARPNQPGVSTRVTEFLDWIHSHIGEEDES